MNKPTVRRDHLGDWIAHCPSHGELSTSSDWELAMESAYGHLAMHHGGGQHAVV